MKKLFAYFLFAFVCSSNLLAQFSFYTTQNRPPGLNWQELKTPHFRIIFPDGLDSTALRAGRILESQYETTKALTGGSLKGFPVVLTDYNDLTNGFVTSLNFRSEVDLAPFKGKNINPQSGAWLEAVLPHELLHANHANLIKPFSFAAFLSAFSPDFGRSVNFFVPLGMHEGLAVYHESTGGAISEFSGRSNYTFYTNQYNSINSASPWSLSQHFVISDYTEPRNRHYLGGSHFTHWLHDTYGDEVSKKAISTHQYFFFLGYGFALRTTTGKWPRQLFNDYNEYRALQEQQRKERIPGTTDDLQTLISSPFKGVEQRKPIWISDDDLVFYSNQYNAPRGFYKMNLSDSKQVKLTESFPVQDFYMYYDRVENKLFFPEYFSLNKYPGSFQSDVVALDIASGTEEIITSRTRTFSPQKIGGELYALQPDEDFANLVQVKSDGAITVVKTFRDETPIGFAVNPVSENEFAIIVNKRGVQALWLTDLESMHNDLEREPDIAFKGGSIHDISWHSSGSKFLFTADAYPAMNVYEYDVESGSVTQLTNSIYNAFEANYSPDDSKIAYVTQRGKEQRIAILPRADFYNRLVPETELLNGEELETALTKPFLGDELQDESEDWEITSYKSNLGWLKPRAVLPVIEETRGAYELGAVFHSTDVLQSQSYRIEITDLQDRFWYDLEYTNAAFFPGFSIRRYSEPSFATLNLEGFGLTTFLQQEKGLELSVPVNYNFKDIARFSSITFRPFVGMERIQFWDLAPNKTSSSSSQTRIGAFTQFNYRLLQLPRDVQPSSGILLFAQMEQTNSDEILSLDFGGNEYRLSFRERVGFFYGANIYLSPLQRFNQSLLVELRALQQTETLLYSTDNIRPLGFPSDVFLGSNNLVRIGNRYTIPVTYPDDGGFLVPFYLSNIYTTLFSHTIFDFSEGSGSSNSRSILGAGIHFRFKISNLGFDLGAGFAFDPTDNEFRFILGDF
ncbi:MAG: hypothetical protein MI700_11820 [Balneolales bacterium]|nr:hypothetical protein [Balneolales bacterium]